MCAELGVLLVWPGHFEPVLAHAVAADRQS
jgi:hypothetical protein